MSNHNIKINRFFSRIIKRLFDIFFAVFFITILSPFMLILFLIIRSDGGSAFYAHERVGRNGKIFKCLKFRSMAQNSKELLEKILQNDPEAKQEWETSYKLKNDPRVTKVGKFIRQTSLDELPQLFNILKGEMSVVGPRPVTSEELSKYKKSIPYYLISKPGLTGLWQVSGRSDVDYDTRVLLDTTYIKNWSFLKDIMIVIKTVKVILTKNGAY
ncbi:sugar transferase [Acinetobacter sp. CAAS 2-6]|uniref:sugar transferase n=1 Tax=Acinetobacter sp. CAAS 2-6 TaxID=3016358 RepID=UPI002DD65552|nr:sugar transferase [Acinetobacter sp. CAAS 2-6]